MAKTKPLKALLLHNVVAPYRLPVFEEISRQLDLTVYFCKTITADRYWDPSLDGYTFNRRVLPDFAVGPFFLNPTLVKHLLRERYDVYLVGDFPEMAFATFITIAVAKLRRKPVVLWSETVDHEVNYFDHLAASRKLRHRALRRALTGLIAIYRRFLLRLPDQFVALSQLAETFLVKEGVDKNSIHMGIQVMPKAQLGKPDTAKANSPYADKKVVLFVGYLRAMKGVDVLIRAFRKVHDPATQLVIVGDGPEAAELKQLARGDKRIKFTGFLNDPHRANLLSWADVMVLPTFADCWGFVVNESLYHGTPVITTSAAGAAELLQHGENGLVVAPRDEIALSRALEQILGDPKTQRRMKASARQLREHITDTAVGARPILEALKAAGGVQ